MGSYQGSCHCGAVRFSVETELAAPIRCNCSFCKRRGTVVEIISAADFTLLEGAQQVAQYGNRPFAKHHFCTNCGIQIFSEITAPGGDQVGFNVGCLADVDLEQLTIKPFDGANIL